MEKNKKEISQDILAELLKAIKDTRFGEIVVTIYDSKVVQIEKREKKRFK